MTKQKLDLSQLYKFIKKETLKKNDIAQVFIPLTQNLVKALWQQLQPQIFWGMMQQALHSSILFYLFAILLFRSSQALSGWLGTIGGQLFIGFSKSVWLVPSPSSDWATRGRS